MAGDGNPASMTIAQAMQLRKQASQLLERLLANRQQSEQRLAETNKRDPLKCVTGRTSYDNAIASAREMILQMDLLIERMQAGAAADHGSDDGLILKPAAADLHTVALLHGGGRLAARAAYPSSARAAQVAEIAGACQ